MYEQIASIVVYGKQLGTTIGFPTINCPVKQSCPDLCAGTYRANVLIEKTRYRGIGPRFPDRQLFEIHLLDTSKIFYTKKVTIIPLVYMRKNRSFATIDLLKKQLQHDYQRATQYRHRIITFGTFDWTHPGHEAYLKQAKQYGDTLITIVARDSTVKKIKGRLPDHTENQRLKNITDLRISNIVELGNEADPYTCLLHHTPEVICLGYDQHSFDKGLRKRCDTHGLENTTIIRLESYQPEKRKSSLIKQAQ